MCSAYSCVTSTRKMDCSSSSPSCGHSEHQQLGTLPHPPGAPRKPACWQTGHYAIGKLEESMVNIGELLCVLSDGHRRDIVRRLPVYDLEDLFLAYCLWYSGTHPRPFDCLLRLAPDLDEQLVSYALAGGGGGVSQCTWEQWEALLLRAAADPAGAGRQAARALFRQQAGVFSSTNPNSNSSSSSSSSSSSKPRCYRVLTF